MILYRYIIKEHIFPFLASLSIIVFLFIMQQMVVLLDRIIAKGLDPLVVLEVFIIQLGWIIALAIPMAILTATLCTFGRMSGDNEITSIKASGRSLYPLMIPVFSAATVLGVLLVFFNDLILPDANHRTANLLSDISRKRPAAFIEPGVLIKDFANYNIYTEEVDPRSGALKGIRIFSDMPGQDPSTTIASHGSVKLTADEQYLELTLYDGETHSISRQNEGDYILGQFEKQVVYIQNVDSRLQRTNSSYRSDREKSSSMMLTDVAELKTSRNSFVAEYSVIIDSLQAHLLSIDSLAAIADSLPKDTLTNSSQTFASWLKLFGNRKQQFQGELQRRGDHLERIVRRINANDLMISQYMVEVHKKFAIPVACLVFVLIGAPLGIMARRGGISVGASYSIFFFIAYWAFLIGGETLADRMVVSPAVAMWSGNVVIGICGIILIILMVRETTIRFDAVKAIWRKLSNQRGGIIPKIASVITFAPRMVFFIPRWILRKIIGTLPTYLINMFLGYVIGVLAAITVVFVVVDYISNLKRFEGATLIEIGLYYYYYLPWLIQMMIPIVLLLASMFAIGKLAKNSELIAMKGSGINIRQLTMPLLALGLVLSAVSFYAGEIFIPRANVQRRELMDNLGQQRLEKREGSGPIIREFRRNFFYFGNKNTTYVFREFSTQPQTAKNVWRESFKDNGIRERIQAEQMLFDSTGWCFVKGRMRTFSGDSSTVLNFDTLRDTILNASPVEMVARIKSKEEMSYWELRSFIDAARKRGEKVGRFMGELEFKIALPFMNFIVILLGIAITARAGRKGSAMLFGVGLLMVFAYWLISRFAIVFAQNGHMPVWLGAWLGNILFFTLSLFLYRKASR